MATRPHRLYGFYNSRDHISHVRRGGIVGERADRIRAEVLARPGITEAPHRFGGIEFRLGTRELGAALAIA
jgi:hypothetical protein